MSFLGAVHDRLTTYAGLVALVSTRVRTGHLRQNETLPAVSLSQIGETRFPNWGADADVYQNTVQIDCWAVTAAGAYAVSVQVLAALDRYSGTHDTTLLEDCRMLNRLGPLVELPEDVTKHYRFLLEFEIDHRG